MCMPLSDYKKIESTDLSKANLHQGIEIPVGPFDPNKAQLWIELQSLKRPTSNHLIVFY